MGGKYIRFFLFISFTAIFSCLFSINVKAQQKVIQLYGVVKASDSTTAMPGASVYIEGTGRGTITNNEGIFSIAVLPGSKVTFSFVGFKSAVIDVPNNIVGDQLKVSPYLVQDTSYLPTTIVTNLPSPAEFRQMFLATNVSYDHIAIAQQNININRLLMEMNYLPMDAGAISNMNYRERFRKGAQKGLVPTSGLLNPFAWSSFIRSLKQGGRR